MTSPIWGLADMVGSVAVVLAPAFSFVGIEFIFYFGIFFVIKGLYYILKTAIGDQKDYFQVFGWLDVVAGIVLILAFVGITHLIFTLFGVFYIFKALFVASVSLYEPTY